MSVSGIVVSHHHAEQVGRLVPLLGPQVDELVVIENVPGSVGDLPADVRVLRNARPLTFAANVNQGTAARKASSSSSPTRTSCLRPTRSPAGDVHAGASASRARRPRMRWPADAGSRRAAGSRLLAARSCGARRRLVFGTYAQRDLPARRARRRTGARGLAPRGVPAHASRDARGARRLGRRLPPLRRGHRPRVPRGEGGVGALVRARCACGTRLRRGRRAVS